MKEWYLMQPPTMFSGDESEEFADYKTDYFSELLQSDIAIDIILYNPDMTIHKVARAIINNKTPDTKLNSWSRHLLLPVGTSKSGMYVKYDNRFWLINGIVDNNTVYEKATMVFCNWYLSWINQQGKIITRRCSITSASQYNSGETGVTRYIVRSDQLSITFPCDDETLMIKDGQRFIIDKRCELYEKAFDNNIKKDTNKNLLVYQVTRMSNILYNYEDCGIIDLIASQDEQRETDGYYVINNNSYWLCDGDDIVINKNQILSVKIDYTTSFIYCGTAAQKFTAKFYNLNNEEIQVEHTWTVDCDFMSDINVSEDGDSIYISTSNPKLINKKINLILQGAGETTTLLLTIKPFL